MNGPPDRNLGTLECTAALCGIKMWTGTLMYDCEPAIKRGTYLKHNLGDFTVQPKMGDSYRCILKSNTLEAQVTAKHYIQGDSTLETG